MFVNTKIITNQNGVTLIELVIAMAILGTAVFGSARLINVAARSSSESGRRTQATILADREIELVRNLRDTNILTDPGEAAWANFPLLLPTDHDNNGATPPQDCVTFVMQSSGSPPNLNWVASSPIAYGSHEPYSSSSAKYFTEESDESYGIYRRSLFMCEVSPGLRRIVAEVVWDEATGPERMVSFNTLLGDWDLEE